MIKKYCDRCGSEIGGNEFYSGFMEGTGMRVHLSVSLGSDYCKGCVADCVKHGVLTFTRGER